MQAYLNQTTTPQQPLKYIQNYSLDNINEHALSSVDASIRGKRSIRIFNTNSGHPVCERVAKQEMNVFALLYNRLACSGYA
jgi:hypothetical protein